MKLTKKGITNIFFVIGVIAVVVMLFTFDVSFVELWGYIRSAGWWLLPIVGIWALVYALNALAWGLITKSVKQPDVHIPMWRMFKLTLSGYALNYATPVAGLGGEPYRIMELSKEIGNQRATSSVILYVMTHMLAHFLFWLSGIIILAVLHLSGSIHLTTVHIILATISTVVILGLVFLFSLGYRYGLVLKLTRWLSRWPLIGGWIKRLMTKHSEGLENVDKQIALLNQQDKGTFYSSLGAEYLSRFVQSLEIMFTLLLFGIDGGGDFAGLATVFLHSVIILTVVTIMSNLLGFLPMQLGGQEGGFVLAITMLGLPPAFGIFICILTRVREIFWIIVGLILMKVKN